MFNTFLGVSGELFIGVFFCVSDRVLYGFQHVLGAFRGLSERVMGPHTIHRVLIRIKVFHERSQGFQKRFR